ncbi:MAG: NAD(+) diphosphatase [Treponema sp.]|uniref:NAD(+) diphosphatase n=1 Tax=Treponema sp. TaxID=166 RepID=UPI00298D713A|nr:NAD(+) diphosphatase [Treponema sp.]MCR5386367.1 NAD(+) diphosphatase [Treponema sp.]
MHPVIIFEREIILRRDNGQLAKADFEAVKNQNPVERYFEEKSTDMQVLVLLSKDKLPDEYQSITLRDYFASHSEEENFIAFRARALASWYKDTVFCSLCGTKLKSHDRLTAMTCPSCGKTVFPRISPCIIVLVYKDNKILLARHVQRNQDIYACIAGFIEAGESAEEAVKREIKEEVGINVKNIQYKGSQSWPFPDQLMLGYTAEYESGDIVLQKEEIADAQWFDPDNCPASPKPGSIAYRLIHGEI